MLFFHPVKYVLECDVRFSSGGREEEPKLNGAANPVLFRPKFHILKNVAQIASLCKNSAQ
jgi:hypothetical protein